MDSVTCLCLRCNGIIGAYDNLWDKIGKTYYSPISWTPSDDALYGLVTDGEVKAAAKAGIIENSFLQDLACKQCGQKLGLRVDSAPEGHVLTRDQLILRIGAMTIISTGTGIRSNLRVRRKFSLTRPQPQLLASKASAERSTTPEQYPDESHRVLNPIRPAVTSSNERDQVSQLVEFAEWAKETIVKQARDIGRISSAVSKLENDMRDFKDFMFEARRDLASTPKGESWHSIKTTVAFLENEVGNLRRELDGRHVPANASEDCGAQISGDDFEMLTDSITKISQKVLDVDVLKMELQFMKSRLKRFEDTPKMARQPLDLTMETSSGQPPQPFDQIVTMTSSTPSRRPALLPSHRAASVSITPQPRRASSILTTDLGSGYAQVGTQGPRKRKYSDLGLDPLDVISVGRNIAESSVPATRRPATHNPSRLSYVQLIEKIPDSNSISSAMERSLFVDGASSEAGDGQAQAYESAPEKGHLTTRREAFNPPERHKTARIASPDLSMPPPPLPHPRRLSHTQAEKASEAAASATRALSPPTSVGASNPRRSQRRAASEIPIVRRYDGVRLTRDGKPDKRSMRRYKHLSASWEEKNGEKIGNGSDDGGEGEDVVDGQASVFEGARARRRGHDHLLRKIKGGRILPSIEKGARNDHGPGSDLEVDAKKRAALQARERLVRETLEREFEG